MFNRRKQRSVLGGTAALLVVAMLSGCATQKVHFSSVPAGVAVVAGKKQGITPCMLNVSDTLTHATFRLPSGEEQILPMPGLDSDVEEVSEVTGQVLGSTLMFAGAVVAGAGLGAFLLGGSSLDNGREWHAEPVADSDESDA